MIFVSLNGIGVRIRGSGSRKQDYIDSYKIREIDSSMYDTSLQGSDHDPNST